MSNEVDNHPDRIGGMIKNFPRRRIRIGIIEGPNNSIPSIQSIPFSFLIIAGLNSRRNIFFFPLRIAVSGLSRVSFLSWFFPYHPTLFCFGIEAKGKKKLLAWWLERRFGFVAIYR